MVIHKIKLLKGGKFAVHSARGPVIELEEGSIVDICDCHCIYNKTLSDKLIEVGWAEIVAEEAEEPEEEVEEQSLQKLLKKDLTAKCEEMDIEFTEEETKADLIKKILEKG